MATVSQIDPTAIPAILSLLTGHFQEGAGYRTWRAQGTTDWLLIYTLDGEGRFGYRGGEVSAQAGDLTMLRPGTPHDYRAEPGQSHWEVLWAHFHPRPHWLDWLAWPERAPGLMLLPLREPVIRQKIVARFREMHRLASGSLRNRDQFAMNALEEVLLWCDTQNPRVEPSPLDRRIQDATEYLSQHLVERVSLDELADTCGLSVSRLSHLFREQVGMTPGQFQEQRRLARARQLLEWTPRSIQAIAAEVGFENPFYFTLRFKRLTGLSPRDFRKSLSQK